jgi:tetratricopeptide (TPR) repeat protein
MFGRRKRRRTCSRKIKRERAKALSLRIPSQSIALTALHTQKMIFCQRCKQANPVEFEYCESCGTRLMLVAKEGEAAFFMHEHLFEEHLLERISLLETAIQRAHDRFEQLLELAQQQATGSFFDHIMLESLTEILTETRAIDPLALENRWRTRVARHHEEAAERERLDERCDQIIAAFRGTLREQREQFIDLIEEGTLLVGEGRTRRGVRMLENALALDENNAELCLTLGQCHFQMGKIAEAISYLQRSLLLHKNNFGAQLLLGLLEGDNGQSESARDHLEQAVKLDEDSFAAHFGLGRLLALEGKLADALSHLKRALTLKPVPEMHYLVGRMYWEKGRVEQALRHLQKAVRLDPEFDAALYSLGWMYWQVKRTPEAREHLRAAYDLNPRDTQYRAAVAMRGGEELPTPPALAWAKLFPPNHQRQKPNVKEARFLELLREDLRYLTLTPARRMLRR